MNNLPVIHLDRQGSSGGSAYIGVFTNYNALIAAFPTAPTMSLAYVQNSQGTPWLPGGIGGTFYSKGSYLFDGVNWVSSVDDISEELQNILDNINTQNLEQVLAEGNFTGPYDIVINENQVVKGDKLLSPKLNFTSNIFNDPDYPTVNFNGATNTPGILVGFAYTIQFDYTGILSVGQEIQVKGTQGGVNDGVHVITALAFNSPNTEIQWAGMTADINSPYGSWAAQGDGTEWTLGSANSRIKDYAKSFGVDTDRQTVSIITTYSEGFATLAARSNQITISEGLAMNMFDSVGFTRFGEINMYNNLLGDKTSVNFGGNFPASFGSTNATFKQFVMDSVSLGGRDMIVKTNGAAYANKIAFNKGEAFETLINYTIPTANRTQTHQDANGTIALVGDTIFDKVVVPTPLVANTNDLLIANLKNFNVIHISTSGANYDLTGIDSTGIVNGKTFFIYNVGTSGDIKFKNNNIGSLAANRFILNGDINVKNGMGVIITYDTTASRWRINYFK